MSTSKPHPTSLDGVDIEALRSLLNQATLKLQGVQHVEVVEHAANGVPMPTDGQHAHQEHGVGIDHDIPQADALQAMPELWWSRIRHIIREPLAEFFGVFILILFGDGVVAQVVLSGGTKGDFQSINWGWG